MVQARIQFPCHASEGTISLERKTSRAAFNGRDVRFRDAAVPQ